MLSEAIYNAIVVSDVVLTSGQPTEEQLSGLATEGFGTVINLAPYEQGHALAHEAEIVASLGMTYYHIPVVWDTPKDTDFAAFELAMANTGTNKTLIHCIANFRVTAFYSLYAQKHLGWSVAQAEALRAPIWEGSDIPVWRAFIARMQAQLNAVTREGDMT